MNSIANIALRFASGTPIDLEAPTSADRPADLNRPWRRHPRTKAFFAIRTLAIQQAVQVLEKSDIPFSQPLPGKLVIQPPPDVPAALTVTYWPPRQRLQLEKRPTKRGQDLVAFARALADQGHRVVGQPYSKPKSSQWSRFELAQAERERRWVERQADIRQAQDTSDEIIALHLQRLKAFASGERIGSRNPELVDAEQRFRSALRRIKRMAHEGEMGILVGLAVSKGRRLVQRDPVRPVTTMLEPNVPF